MQTAWKERGGLPAYRQHVREIVDKFGHVTLHEQTWQSEVPKSSMPAHLFLCAVRQLEADSRTASEATGRAAWAVRQAFFRDGRDISCGKVLLEIAEAIELHAGQIESTIA